MSLRRTAWVLALMACELDASGVDGDDTGSSSSSDGTGNAPTSNATTMPTSAPTTADTSMATTDTPTETSADTTANDTTATDDGDEESTGDVELGPFGAPVPVEELNTDDIEDDVTLSADMLEIYFSRSSFVVGPFSEDIYRAVRDSVDEPFGPAEVVMELSFPSSPDASPELSSDGLVMSFSGNWPGGNGGNDVMITTREDLDAPWETPVQIIELSTRFDDASLAFDETTLVGYFCRNLGAGVDWELFRSERDGLDETWTAAIPLEALNGDGRDCGPWIDAGETELWFHSVRNGGTGMEDIWHVAIDRGMFGEVEAAEELNSEAIDEDPWLSPDRRTVFFASNRDEGDFDLYMAERDP